MPKIQTDAYFGDLYFRNSAATSRVSFQSHIHPSCDMTGVVMLIYGRKSDAKDDPVFAKPMIRRTSFQEQCGDG